MGIDEYRKVRVSQVFCNFESDLMPDHSLHLMALHQAFNAFCCSLADPVVPPAPLLPVVHLYEIADRTVVSSLELGAEETRRKLAVLAVIVQALAAFMLALARFIGAIAQLSILFDNTIHSIPPDWNIFYCNCDTVNMALSKYQARDYLYVGQCREMRTYNLKKFGGRIHAGPANHFIYLNFMTAVFFVFADGRVPPHCLPVFCPMALRTGMYCLGAGENSPSFLGAASP
jgi:hypothetical protein